MFDVSSYTTDSDFVWAEWSFVIISSSVIFVIILIVVAWFILKRKRNADNDALNRRLLNNQININAV